MLSHKKCYRINILKYPNNINLIRKLVWAAIFRVIINSNHTKMSMWTKNYLTSKTTYATNLALLDLFCSSPYFHFFKYLPISSNSNVRVHIKLMSRHKCLHITTSIVFVYYYINCICKLLHQLYLYIITSIVFVHYYLNCILK